jgi:hypothetical protein
MSKRIIALIAVLMMGMGLTACGEKTPLTEEQRVYAGKWVAADGSFVEMFFDGTGSFKYGNTEVTGGFLNIEDGIINISFMGIGKDFKITSEPQEVNDYWVMELDGIEFTKIRFLGE